MNKLQGWEAVADAWKRTARELSQEVTKLSAQLAECEMKRLAEKQLAAERAEREAGQ